ncbi:MAG: hypothetical protein H6Q42_2852 [Deltaproteobacteria bacterium]|jgi:hypothetical protein|nr:hypothetical protein [Deltaproteobacteria bacterium]
MGFYEEITLPMAKGSHARAKRIRLAKKGGDPDFLEADHRRFSPGIPWPPRLFAEINRRELAIFLPALFGFGACFFARATRRSV